MNLSDLAQKHGFKPKGILHVGAGWLEEAQQYEDMGVKAVIWVEADYPREQRQKRATQFGHALYECLPLSDRCECVDFRVASNDASSSILPFARHSTIYPDIVVKETHKMLTLRADQVFNEGLVPDIDTLVLDVQGAELKVLRGMGKLLDQIQRIWAEVNLKELYTGCVLKPELDDWLAKAGFGNSEFYPVHQEEWGECLYWR
jgi:FkbM family methyltransferase